MKYNLEEEIENELPLTPKQERFCLAYTQGDTTFSNGTLAYAYAYGYDLDEADKTLLVDEKGKEIPKSSDWDRMMNTCAVCASRMLRNVKIQRRNVILLNEAMNEMNVDAELMKVIKQDGRLDAKVQAVKEFNALKGRIIKRSDVTSDGERIVVLPAEIMAKHALAEEQTVPNIANNV